MYKLCVSLLISFLLCCLHDPQMLMNVKHRHLHVIKAVLTLWGVISVTVIMDIGYMKMDEAVMVCWYISVSIETDILFSGNE